MKLQSDGNVVLEINEEKIKEISNGSEYDFEMLKQMTKAATLLEVSCRDHIEMRQMLTENSKTLAKIAAILGTLIALLAGASVVI